MEEYHTQCDGQNKVILLDLANNASSDEVKTIIQHYDVDKNSDEIYKLMNASLKPPIAETAEYLNINSSQLKDQLIRSIICKINSLLLEKCLKCSQYYAATLQDNPIAVCECGQPCHEPCYSDLKEFLNGKYPGVVFQCSRCFKKPAQDIIKDNIPPERDVTTKDDDKDKTVSECEESPKPPTFVIKVTESFNLDLLQARYPQQSYPICEAYKRFNCPHGRDGKTEIDNDICKNLHPKKCFAWCKAGNNKKSGCQKGSNCPFYHPVLCRDSLRYRKCLNPKCTFTHLQLTQRYKRRNEGNNEDEHFNHEARNREFRSREFQEENTRNYKASLDRNNQPTQRPWAPTELPSANSTTEVPSNVKTFLGDLIQSLKDDMKQSQKEMYEFKKSIASQVAQLQPQLWQTNLNHQLPVPATHHNTAPNQMQLPQVNQPEQTAVYPQFYPQMMYRHQLQTQI